MNPESGLKLSNNTESQINKTTQLRVNEWSKN